MSHAVIDSYDELPTIEGPKLGRFKRGHHGAIQYLELLSKPSESDNDEDSDVEENGGIAKGEHSCVFRVMIDTKAYALKVFHYYDVNEALCMMDPAGRSFVAREDVEGQKDPFYAECRAYGRIAEKRRKLPIAIACHGFVSIPAAWEKIWEREFNVGSSVWKRPDDDTLKPEAKRQPFRALVKSLVRKDPPVTGTLIKSMRRELMMLNKLRIYVMDVRWSNYRGGHLVDFSSAWTEPHYEFSEDVNFLDRIEDFKRFDLYHFDEMLKEELPRSLVDQRHTSGDGTGVKQQTRKRKQQEKSKAWPAPDKNVIARLRPRERKEGFYKV